MIKYRPEDYCWCSERKDNPHTGECLKCNKKLMVDQVRRDEEAKAADRANQIVDQAIRSMKFCWSICGESYKGNFDTRDEAIEEAVKHLTSDLKTRPMFEDEWRHEVWTGSVVPIRADHFEFDADNICDTLAVQAFDAVGDMVRDWPGPPDKDLILDIESAVASFVGRVGIPFWRVGHIECVMREF